MQTTTQIIAVLALMASGALARRRGWLSETGTADLTRVLVNLIYPSLIIVSVPQLSLRDLAENAVMPVMAMVLALTGLLLGLVALRFLGRMTREASGSFLFQSVFCNYLFLPLPMVMLLWGDLGVALLLFSSVMFEAMLWTFGVFLLARGRDEGSRWRSLLNPSFCALVCTLLFVALRDALGWRDPQSWTHQAPAAEGVRMVLLIAGALGQGTIPVSMLIAGSRVASLKPGSMMGGRVWAVSAVRLVLVPLCMIPLLRVAPMEETARGVLTVVAVMPCAVASVFFSERFGGDRDFIAGTLLLTHIWALVTVPAFLAWAL